MNSSPSPKLKLTWDKSREARQWCEQNISPRQYWLHSQIGGKGWKMHCKYSDGYWWYLETDDPKYISWIQLTLD